MGCGNKVQFWNDRWLGRDTFAELFPTMFDSCSLKEVVVEDMGAWIDNSWRWNWEWATELLPNETQNLQQMQDLLLSVSPTAHIDDRWIWLHDTVRGFTVKSCYSWLSVFFASDGGAASSSLLAVWPKLWRNNIPSKVLIFAWRVLLGRIATRDALFRKGILRSQRERCCVFCSNEDETVSHLFLHCNVAKSVWNQIFRWMGCPNVEEEELSSHFTAFGDLIMGKKRKRVKHLIWLAVIWNIWLARNKVIFKGEVASIPSLVAGVKDVAWGWFKARQGRACEVGWPDWYNCPMGCFSSL